MPERRAEQLIDQGLAERQARGLVFARNLIGTLRKREVEVLGEQLAAETGRPFNAAAAGEYVAGTYRQRFALASGRFAVIDDGLGFQLVPWSPSLEKQPSCLRRRSRRRRGRVGLRAKTRFGTIVPTVLSAASGA
jgi:hypothetical protein